MTRDPSHAAVSCPDHVRATIDDVIMATDNHAALALNRPYPPRIACPIIEHREEHAHYAHSTVP